MFADLFLEHVSDNVPKVHQNPFRRRATFDAQSRIALRREHTVREISHGTRLARRLYGTKDQVVRDRGEFGDVENDDVERFLVKHRPGDREGFGSRFLCDRRPPEINPVELYRIPLGAATGSPGSIPPVSVA